MSNSAYRFVIDQLPSLSVPADWVLLLDIDGTLSEFHPDPQQSFIPQTTLGDLAILQRCLPVWLVTGRSLADARRLCAGLDLPIIAQHGLLSWLNGKSQTLVAFEPSELAAIKNAVSVATAHRRDWLIEDKPCSVALHTRACPELSNEAASIMQLIAKMSPNWQLQTGRLVWEIMPKDVSKGAAIERLLIQQYPTRRAVFIGDDVSDESGFIAVQNRGGVGIKVSHCPSDGDKSPMTQARFFVPDVPAVAGLLHIWACETLCQS